MPSKYTSYRGSNSSRIILIGCGKSKQLLPSAAADLYTGGLFRARREYAEATGRQWFIVSAKFGLVSPDQLLPPYDARLDEQCEADRAAWALGVALELLSHVGDMARLREITVEIHAGEVYASQLRDVLIAAGFCVDWPVQHMSQGEQMQFYSENRQSRAA
jgi:hypothetical protein